MWRCGAKSVLPARGSARRMAPRGTWRRAKRQPGRRRCGVSPPSRTRGNRQRTGSSPRAVCDRPFGCRRQRRVAGAKSDPPSRSAALLVCLASLRWSINHPTWMFSGQELGHLEALGKLMLQPGNRAKRSIRLSAPVSTIGKWPKMQGIQGDEGWQGRTVQFIGFPDVAPVARRSGIFTRCRMI